ncbi:MAG: hypothetical protein DELT_00197 [Desulfovibrio sp.]
MPATANESTLPTGRRDSDKAIAEVLHELPEAPQDPELVRLRRLLFSREIALLDKIVERQDKKQYGAQKVSEVIAEAITMRSAKDHQLNMALEPLVDDILKESLRRRQNDFVNALFPLMGPTIRKSIAETFRSMLESFSKSVEMAFSWRGLRWRFEAWRSGKSFSEIVMLHTLVYRVEQVFFIHSETGLVLSHVENEGVGSQDADMVSAMLTAIQDFARDSFATGSEGELESLQMGDIAIFIEKSSKAYLACVVRGTPPATYRALLRETLEMMLVEYDEALSAFSGDTSPFITSIRYLDACMVARFVDEEKKLPLWAKVVPTALLILALGWFGIQYYTESKRADLLNGAVLALRAEPGLMITNVVRHKSAPWQVEAFKDTLTRNPEDVLREKGVEPSLFAFKTVPFISYDSSIVARRAMQAIPLPEGVTMNLDEGGTLSFKGQAPMSWILQVRELVRSLPGVKHVDFRELRDPMVDEMTALIKAVEGVSIEFPLGKDVPVSEDLPKLKKAVDTLVELEKIAKHMGLVMSLTIYGHADSVGLDKRNYEISQARARTVAAMLYAKGSSTPISMYGLGAEYPKGGKAEEQPKKADQASRRIELRVHMARAASADTQIFEY